MAELFQSSRTNIVEHIKHIYDEGELDENATCRNFRQVQKEGARNVERELLFYNLDLIISLGYRIKSRIATQFRIKNYLSETELKILNNFVSGYFDFAEIQAIKHKPMYMDDYVRHLDSILSSTGENVLENAGSVSHEKAVKKALAEYRKYQVKTLSPVEQAYLETIKKTEKKINAKTKRAKK